MFGAWGQALLGAKHGARSRSASLRVLLNHLSVSTVVAVGDASSALVRGLSGAGGRQQTWDVPAWQESCCQGLAEGSHGTPQHS